MTAVEGVGAQRLPPFQPQSCHHPPTGQLPAIHAGSGVLHHPWACRRLAINR